MFFPTNLVRLALLFVLVTDVASASHLHRYHRYHRREAIDHTGEQVSDLNFDILAKYICTPCSAVDKREEPAINIPKPDLPSLYSELQALKAETINRMTAAGIAPAKRSIFSVFTRSDAPDVVRVPATEFDVLKTYVCPSDCIAKRETRINIKSSVNTNINININVPAEQLQSVLDAINKALKQVEALLRSLGLPIPEGSFPVIGMPGAPAPPAPSPETPTPPPTDPAPIDPAPVDPAPETPQEPPAPAPEPTTTPAPADPSPTNTIRTTSTNTVTSTSTNGIATTILVTPSPVPTSGREPNPAPDAGLPGAACPGTVTVNSTTTIFEGAEETGVAA